MLMVQVEVSSVDSRSSSRRIPEQWVLCHRELDERERGEPLVTRDGVHTDLMEEKVRLILKYLMIKNGIQNVEFLFASRSHIMLYNRELYGTKAAMLTPIIYLREL